MNIDDRRLRIRPIQSAFIGIDLRLNRFELIDFLRAHRGFAVQ